MDKWAGLLLLLLMSAWTMQLNAQAYGYSIKDDRRRAIIPFTQVNNLIIVPVSIGKHGTRNFILDTGSSYTILTKPWYMDSLNLTPERKVPIFGSDRSQILMADVVRNVDFSIGNVMAEFQSILVLEEDILRFEEFMGIEITGILGIDFFRRFVVRINYDENRLTVYNKPPRRYPRRYDRLPLDFVNGRIMVDCVIYQPQSGLTAKELMLDTGASLALLFNAENEDVELPPVYIRGDLGRGLGGNIEGIVGRVPFLYLGPYRFESVLTSFHIPAEENKDIIYPERAGILGSEILTRFEVIIDLSKRKLLLSPSRRFGESFEYDMSGLVLEPYRDDDYDYVFEVQKVVQNSPAYHAGIREGDTILYFSGIQGKVTPVKVFNMLKSNQGRLIRATLLRNDMEINTSFRLNRLI